MIEDFRADLRKAYALRGAVYDELNRLAEMVRSGINLALECWCAPCACHSDVVKTAIEGINRSFYRREAEAAAQPAIAELSQ